MKEPEAERASIRVELTPTTVLVVILALLFTWLFFQLWPIFLVIVVALMIVGMLDPFVAALEKRGWRRNLAIAAVFTGLFAIAGLLCAFTVPRFFTQLAEMMDRLPQAQKELAEKLDGTHLGAPLAKSLRETQSTEVVASLERLGLAYSTKAFEVIAYSVTSLFLALYLVVDRDRMRGGAFALIPRAYHVRLSRVLLNLETIVGGYMRGQIITSVMMAVFTFVVLSVARVPNAIALATFAAVVDVLPYVGALLVCVPAALASLSRGTTTALVVFLVLAVYQEIESRFIVPRIYGKVLRLPAATVMIALLIGGKLMGILGALLALPIAAGIRMVVEELRVDLPGEDVDDTEVRRLDERGEKDFERRAAGAPAAEAAAIASEIAEERIIQDAKDETEPTEVPFAKKS